MSYEDEAARSWTTGDSLQVNNVTAKIGLQYEQPVGRGSSFILGATYKFSTAFTGYHIHYEQMGVYRNSKTDNLSTSGLRMGDELGIGDGETTADGLFSLKEVACLGCCSLSPVMMVNETTYGSLTPDKAREIVRRIKAEGAAS